MTELEHIEIEGFKGIEHVEFEPAQINLITGRNNTGKTSFLEALNVSFNLDYIDHFERKVDKIVNMAATESRIQVRTTDYVTSLVIRRPTPSEAKKYFVKTVVGDLSFRRDGLHGFAFNTQFDTEDDFVRMIEERTDMDSGTVGAKIESSLKRVATNTLNETLEDAEVAQFQDECLLFVVDSEQFPYVYFDSSMDALQEHYDEIGSAFQANIEERFGIKSVRPPGENGEFKYPGGDRDGFFDFLFNQPPDEGVFLRKPTRAEELLFIESGRLAAEDWDIDPEKHAIKIDNIGDYVNNAELVDELKTFNLNYLIFERNDGEKFDVPFEFMGDGFKSMVGLLWELMDDDVENDIVLIEEPETHMHPGYVAELVHFLIDLARDEDIQFFITTHDHDFIKDFFMDMPDEKREYLEDEFSLVKMDDFGADVMEYEEAEHHLKDLHLDLRGI